MPSKKKEEESLTKSARIYQKLKANFKETPEEVYAVRSKHESDVAKNKLVLLRKTDREDTNSDSDAKNKASERQSTKKTLVNAQEEE